MIRCRRRRLWYGAYKELRVDAGQVLQEWHMQDCTKRDQTGVDLADSGCSITAGVEGSRNLEQAPGSFIDDPYSQPSRRGGETRWGGQASGGVQITAKAQIRPDQRGTWAD